MRTLRLLALAAGLIVPAAAAHAQVGIYVGPSARYAAPAYAPGIYTAPLHWQHRLYPVYPRPYVVAPAPFYGGFQYDWRGGRGWAHEGRYARGSRW